MINITEKDIQRAKPFYHMSHAQQNAAANRIKDHKKCLARAMAVAQEIEFSFTETRILLDRAQELNTSIEELEFAKNFIEEQKKKFQKIRDDQHAKRSEELWKTVPEGLAKSLWTNTWCDYDIKTPHGKRRVDIFHDMVRGDYYCDYKKTHRSKNTTRLYLGNDNGKWSSDVTTVKVAMIKKYQIVDPYNGDREARMNRYKY